MKNVENHAETWVIHENEALLFRQREGQAVEELRMQFDEFLGSATALASFSLPDTRVFLNVGPGLKPGLQAGSPDRTVSFSASSSWAGVADSPTRLVTVPWMKLHSDALESLKSMGKKAGVVSTTEPLHFMEATVMALLNPQELKHLQTAVRMGKSDAGKFKTLSGLGLNLWLQPDTNYRKLRWATVIGMAISAAAINLVGHNSQHPIKEDIAPSPAKSAPIADQAAPDFSDWAAQIKKFGQDNRANIRSVQIFWTEQGQIFSQVELDRERKRVPKGCKLVNSRRADCATESTDQ